MIKGPSQEKRAGVVDIDSFDQTVEEMILRGFGREEVETKN